MFYNELFGSFKNSYADLSSDIPFAAIQINITGQAEGIFYIKAENGSVDIEPYDYKDNNAVIEISTDLLKKVADKEVTFSSALSDCNVMGDTNLAASLVSAFDFATVKNEVKTEVKVEEEAEVKAEVKKEALKTDVKTEVKEKVKAETKAESKKDVVDETKTDSKEAVKSEAGTEVKATTEVKTTAPAKKAAPKAKKPASKSRHTKRSTKTSAK